MVRILYSPWRRTSEPGLLPSPQESRTTSCIHRPADIGALATKVLITWVPKQDGGQVFKFPAPANSAGRGDNLPAISLPEEIARITRALQSLNTPAYRPANSLPKRLKTWAKRRPWNRLRQACAALERRRSSCGGQRTARSVCPYSTKFHLKAEPEPLQSQAWINNLQSNLGGRRA